MYFQCNETNGQFLIIMMLLYLYISLSILNGTCYKAQKIILCIGKVLFSTETFQVNLQITKSEKSFASKWPNLWHVWKEHSQCMLNNSWYLLPKEVNWLINWSRYTEHMFSWGLNNNIHYLMCFSQFKAIYFQPIEFLG